MTLMRAAFIFALLMLGLGVIGSGYFISSLFAQGPPAPAYVTNTPRPAATSTPAPLPTTQPTPLLRRTPTPRPTPRPTPTAPSGTVSLVRYWVGTLNAHPGQTIAVGYVIDNGTGRLAHVMLGASVKPTRALSWLRAAISDPSHDVVATVPPGVTTHVRFFTLPWRLRPGWYDVAWGLRAEPSGAREALVAADGVLHVHS